MKISFSMISLSKILPEDFRYISVFLNISDVSLAGLDIATDTVTNATNIFSLATENSGLVATLTTKFLYDLDLN